MITTKVLLPGSDFTEPPEPKDQAIALVFALPGDGKTTMGLSGAPDPVAFMDIDLRGRHAAKKAKLAGKKILYHGIEMPKLVPDDAAMKRAAELVWGKLEKNFDIAVRESQKGNVRTITLDTVSSLTDLAKLCISGRTDKKNDDYGRSTHLVKTKLTKLIKSARDGNANLVMLAHAKELWVNNQPTGKYTFIGHEVLEADADWAGHLRLVRSKTTRRKTQDHELEVTKAGIDLTQLGEVYKEEDWEEWGPFVYGCIMNYPGTSPDTWM